MICFPPSRFDMSEVTPAGAGARSDETNGYGAQQRARVDERLEREQNRAEQVESSRRERTARSEHQPQERSEQMRREEATQAAQRAEDNRGQNLQVEQEQGRGQAVDTIV